MQKRSSWRWLGWAMVGLAACVGLKLGFDFGLRISGVLMGVVLSLCTGLMGALLASGVVERLGRWRGVPNDTEPPPEAR